MAVRNAAPGIESDMNTAFRIGLLTTQADIAFEKAKPREAVIRRLARSDAVTGLLDGLGLGHSSQHILQNLDLDRCPALSLWASLWRKYAADRNRKIQETDRADISYLPAYAYADYALTERFHGWQDPGGKSGRRHPRFHKSERSGSGHRHDVRRRSIATLPLELAPMTLPKRLGGDQFGELGRDVCHWIFCSA